MPITRRTFLKLVGLGTGVAAVAAVPGLSERPSGLVVPQIPASLHPDPEREAWDAGETPALYHGYDTSELWTPLAEPVVLRSLSAPSMELHLTLVFRSGRLMTQYHKLLGVLQAYRVVFAEGRDMAFTGYMTDCSMQVDPGREIRMDVAISVVLQDPWAAPREPQATNEVVFIPATRETSGYTAVNLSRREQQDLYGRW